MRMGTVRKLVFLLEGTSEKVLERKHDFALDAYYEPTGERMVDGSNVYEVRGRRDTVRPVPGEICYDVALVGSVAAPAVAVCPLCGNEARTVEDDVPTEMLRTATGYDCATCGRYVLDRYALIGDSRYFLSLGDTTTLPCVSAYTRRRTILRSRPGYRLEPAEPVPVLFGTLAGNVSPPAGYVGIDTILKACENDVAARLDLALLNLADMSGTPGNSVTLRPADYPVAYADSERMLRFMLSELRLPRLVSWNAAASGHGPRLPDLPCEVALTAEGWARAAQIRAREREAARSAASSPPGADAPDTGIDKGGTVVMEADERRLKAFLCHGSEDKPGVRTLYRQLKEAGFQPWLDEEDLGPGQDWRLEIGRAVRGADVILVCLSATSVGKSGYVQKEIAYALDAADEKPEGTIYVVPVRLEECKVPDRLSRWQWVDLYKDGGLDRLLAALGAKARSLGGGGGG